MASALAAASPLAAVQRSLDVDPEAASGPVVVFLVRHAEKLDDGTDDPPLSLAGRIRTMVLSRLLADVELSRVHTTDWKRTRETVRPFAEEMGVDPVIYDPRELGALAERIRASPGTHLVAGHSNTTPLLVEALGGNPFDPIDEYEYDRLYIVVLHAGQPPVTTLLRFGEPYAEGFDIGLRQDRGFERGSLQRRRN